MVVAGSGRITPKVSVGCVGVGTKRPTTPKTTLLSKAILWVAETEMQEMGKTKLWS